MMGQDQGKSAVSFWRSSRLAGGIAIVAALAVSGCASRGGPIPYNVSDFGAPDQAYASIPAEELIAPLDKLDVSVFRVPDLSGSYEVSVGGRVSLPLIGDVVAVNRTPAELASVLEQRYDTQYLRDPDIAVTITETQNSRISVDGAVSKPGAFAVRGGTDLMTAIAMSGGVTNDANSKRIAIFRRFDGETRAAAFDLSMIRDGEAENPAIYPGDIIYVDNVGGVPTVVTEIIRGLSTVAIFTRIF